MRRILICLLFLSGIQAFAGTSHDIASLAKWGPYSKEYYGISHINDLSSGIQVEFCLVPGQYRRNFKVPCALFESGVHPWRVSADMRHITYRHDIEWKDRVFVDATYHVVSDSMVLLEARCVNNTDQIQNINLQLAVRKAGGADGRWTPKIVEGDGFFTVGYPEVDAVYGIAWNYPMSEVRQFRCAKLEHLMPLKAHDHVFKNLKGDMKGHYTANFLRPVTLRPQSDTTIVQMIVCGKEEYVRRELEAWADELPGFGRDITSVPLGIQLLQATLFTNVVYPIDAFGEPIRHFCPGKRWNSLYTWDCGFIGWAMSLIDASRGYEVIRQYTTTPEEDAPFVHHGTPLATQILAMGDVWMNGGSDEAQLREIYPRLKRFYDYMTGARFRKASGLLETWNLFYNSGGWDDYPPQWTLRPQKELRSRTLPMVSASYYIRCARILRLMASHLGKKKDVRQFDADIKAMADGILKNAWDADSGYFGYVEHDADGKALRIFTTPEGVNYNMGLDGVTPLVAGITDEAQKEALLGHIFTKGELWSDCGISAVDQRAPYYREDGYWNGTVWMPHQMILWKTMLDLGLPEKARLIADTALENWERECEDSYNCYEHFMIKTGRGGGWYNFSGLSSPILNWWCAYNKPGTVSTGFGTLVSQPFWNEGKTEFSATLEFDRELVGKSVSMLICAAPGEYAVGLKGGKTVKVSQNGNGLVEITLVVPRKSLFLHLNKKQAE